MGSFHSGRERRNLPWFVGGDSVQEQDHFLLLLLFWIFLRRNLAGRCLFVCFCFNLTLKSRWIANAYNFGIWDIHLANLPWMTLSNALIFLISSCSHCFSFSFSTFHFSSDWADQPTGNCSNSFVVFLKTSGV